MIVMGIFLLIISWRLSRQTGRWTTRMIRTGAVLLGLGYGLMAPLQEAGILGQTLILGEPAEGIVISWKMTKSVIMNSGWLLLGLGLAMHAGIFPRLTKRTCLPISNGSHESVA